MTQGWQSEAADGPKGAWGLLSFSFFLSFSLCFSIFLWVSTNLPTDLSVNLSICLSVYLSVCLSIYLPIYLSIDLSHLPGWPLSLSLSSNYLSIYLPFYLSVYLSIYLSSHLYIYLSISSAQLALSPPFQRACLVAHLHLLSADSFASILLSSNLSLFSASALLSFLSVHSWWSLTSKLPSIIYCLFIFVVKQQWLDGRSEVNAHTQQTFDCGALLALDVNEKILLHGTACDNANSIVREAFDHRTCEKFGNWQSALAHVALGDSYMVHLAPMILFL